MASQKKKLITCAIISILSSTFITTAAASLSIDTAILLWTFLSTWFMGYTYSFDYHLRNMNRLLNPALKLSIISWFSFNNGFLGMAVLIIYFTYTILLGWIYGWYQVIRDLL